MLSEANQERAQIFWKAFKVWGGIIAIPGAAMLVMALPQLLTSSAARPASVYYELFRFGFWYVLAPGAGFGGLGAAVLTLLIQPGQKFRALVVGAVVGLGCPAAFFTALALILPKNEMTMGWAFAAIIYGGIGAFAGVMAGNAIASYPA